MHDGWPAGTVAPVESDRLIAEQGCVSVRLARRVDADLGTHAHAVHLPALDAHRQPVAARRFIAEQVRVFRWPDAAEEVELAVSVIIHSWAVHVIDHANTF